MKLRNILIGLGILYFLTKKKEKTFFDPKKDSVPLKDKESTLREFSQVQKEVDRENRDVEIIDIKKKDIETIRYR
jgi:hypothetical protein